ncbi:hypothetical protein MMC13_003450 [Lambiella insularis]|nr:hypothetical protein [Lambiella insularis]
MASMEQNKPDLDAATTASDGQAVPIATEQPSGQPKIIQSSTQDTIPPGVQRTPFTHPFSASSYPPKTPLTDEQTMKYNSLYNTVCSFTAVPITATLNSPVEPITDAERMWLTRECLLRYLRATKWSVPNAANRLMGTLTWRREYGLSKLTQDYISIENETGKQVILGYDNDCRPCLYLNPSKQNTKKSDRQLQHLVFMLERTIDLMGPAQDSLALLINFNETSSGQSPSLAQGRQTMNFLQNHYPERLGRACVINIPWFFWGFYKLVGPFIDPFTKQKLKFNEEMRLHVPPSQLMKTHGGEVAFEYSHDTYWPALNKLADERRKLQEERWIKGGKRVGESEVYLKGGDERSVGEAIVNGEKKAAKKSVKMSDENGVDDITEKVQGLQTAEVPAQEAVKT